LHQRTDLFFYTTLAHSRNAARVMLFSFSFEKKLMDAIDLTFKRLRSRID
jgi:hypothetical protein